MVFAHRFSVVTVKTDTNINVAKKYSTKLFPTKESSLKVHFTRGYYNKNCTASLTLVRALGGAL